MLGGLLKNFHLWALVAWVFAFASTATAQTAFLPNGHSGVWLGTAGSQRANPYADMYSAALAFRGRVVAGCGLDTEYDKWAFFRLTPINPDSTTGRGLELQVLRLWEEGENHLLSGELARTWDYHSLQSSLTLFHRLELSQRWRFLGSVGAFFRWGTANQSFRPGFDEPMEHIKREFGDLGLTASTEILYRGLAYAALEFDYSQQDYASSTTDDWALGWGLRLGVVVDFHGWD